MVEIKGTTITMIKGDSVIIKISITDSDGNEYTPESGDRIRFAMKRNYTDAVPLLVIEIPIDTMELVINPEDTKELEAGLSKGRYKYDIELTKEDGTVDTVIPRAELVILEEVL